MSYPRLLVFVFLVLLGVTPIYGADYSLLVGVGAYSNLPDKSLEGPPNDVRLLKKVLLKRGFTESHIRMLTDGDGSDGLPDRNNILQALERLTKKVSQDDFVYLHFSGHGARQPQSPDADDLEPDGLDEIFLPSDVMGWKNEIQSVEILFENAINDNEFGRYISAMRRKGAFVWAVFDTCHSGTMVRGASVRDVAYRQLDDAALGIPQETIDITRIRSKTMKDTQNSASNSDQSNWGGFVAFYAAQPNELAPELRLPYRSETGQWHGLFSYTLAEILATERPMTYRQAAQQILQRYGGFNQSRPTPMFEGTGLNTLLLGKEVLSETPQWPLSVGYRGIKIPIGTLGQMDKGSILAIMEQSGDPIGKTLGYLEVIDAGQFDAALTPVHYRNTPQLNRKDIPKNAWARLVARAFDFDLRVALPDLTGIADEPEAAVLDLIKEMRAQPGNMVSLQWVEAGEPADVRLSFSPLMHSECAKNRIWVLAASAEIQCSGENQSIAIDMKMDPSKLQRKIGATLSRIAKVINLQRIASQLSDADSVEGLDIHFEVESVSGGTRNILSQHIVQELVPDDKVVAYAENSGAKAVDLTVLFIDSRYGIQAIFPTNGHSNRIGPGGKIKLFSGKVDTTSFGLERMMVIAVQAQPKMPETHFTYLEQPSLQKTISKRNGAKTDWQDLFNAAGFGLGNQRGPVGRMGDAGISIYRWRVKDRISTIKEGSE